MCVLCDLGFGVEHKGKLKKLREKGSEGINKCSRERNDEIAHTIPGQYVHRECRRVYCLPQNIEQAKKNDEPHKITKVHHPRKFIQLFRRKQMKRFK